MFCSYSPFINLIVIWKYFKFRYNNYLYAQPYPQYFNPYVFYWPNKNFPINSFSKQPQKNDLSILNFQLKHSKAMFLFNQTQYSNSRVQQMNIFTKPLKTNLSIPIQQQMIMTPQSLVQFRQPYRRINRNFNPFV